MRYRLVAGVGEPVTNHGLRSVEHFTTKAAARARVAAWIEEYNTNRRHSACQMMSPVNYEKTLAA